MTHLLQQGTQGPSVRKLQQRLLQFGYRVAIDGVFGPDTHEAVIRFQYKTAIYADGIVGPVTARALNISLEDDGELVDSIVSPTPDPEQPVRVELVDVAADVVSFRGSSGYNRFHNLRSDAGASLEEIAAILHAAGAVLPSSGAIRSLSAEVSANRSATSPHYVALAVDLFIWAAGMNAELDPLLITRDPENPKYLRTYAKASNAEHELVKTLDLEVIELINRGQAPATREMTATVIDVSALFLERGWRRVPPRSWYWTRGQPEAAEWWHWQFEQPLVAGKTTFGECLLAVWGDAAKASAPWKYRNHVYKVNWLSTSG